MENEIRVEYIYNGKPYDLNSHRFDIDNVENYTKRIRDVYNEFKDKIIQQGGYIELTLREVEGNEKAVQYDSVVKGITQTLSVVINSKKTSEGQS